MMIVAGIGFMAIQPALKDARVNQAYQDVLMPLRIARQRAIAERKQYIVCFGLTTPTGALTPLGAPTAQSVQIFAGMQARPSPRPLKFPLTDCPRTCR